MEDFFYCLLILPNVCRAIIYWVGRRYIGQASDRRVGTTYMQGLIVGIEDGRHD